MIKCTPSSHHTHSWTLDGDHHVFSTHVVMAANTTRAAILAMKQSARELLAGHEFVHVTIETELEGEPCHDEHGHAAAGEKDDAKKQDKQDQPSN